MQNGLPHMRLVLGAQRQVPALDVICRFVYSRSTHFAYIKRFDSLTLVRHLHSSRHRVPLIWLYHHLCTLHVLKATTQRGESHVRLIGV